MNLTIIGTNHRSAPVEIREQFALREEEARKFLQHAVEQEVLEEALVLNTCNRMELYARPADGQDPLAFLLSYLSPRRGLPSGCDAGLFYRYDGMEAVSHLFRVAASLDSQIIGEDEILGQVKDAYRLACECGATNVILNKLLHRTFRVGKRVRTETCLSPGPNSVARAAVQLIDQRLSGLPGRSVMVVGAGQTGETAAEALLQGGAERVVVVNRTLKHARSMVERLSRTLSAAPVGAETVPVPAVHSEPRHVRAEPLCQMQSMLDEMDAVICSTTAPGPVLNYEDHAEVLRSLENPLQLVDIAVPRDVDPRLASLPRVQLCNIDDLGCQTPGSQADIAGAREIVEEEVRTFRKWLDSRRVVPTIKLLQQHMEQLQEAEIERYGADFAPEDQESLEKFAKSLCAKILHGPLAYLNEVSSTSEDDEHTVAAEMIRRIFGLDSWE